MNITCILVHCLFLALRLEPHSTGIPTGVSILSSSRIFSADPSGFEDKAYKTMRPLLPAGEIPTTSPPIVSHKENCRIRNPSGHTSQQLNTDGTAYEELLSDPEGEKKIDKFGALQQGRRYLVKTFTFPEMGSQLLMLARESARVLDYRDSGLMFVKNPSLYRVYATSAQKEQLCRLCFLAYSSRSSHVIVLTARSLFRQFGSRIVENGQRVRDDYWVDFAKQQGFRITDAAGTRQPVPREQRTYDLLPPVRPSESSSLYKVLTEYKSETGEFDVHPRRDSKTHPS